MWHIGKYILTGWEKSRRRPSAAPLQHCFSFEALLTGPYRFLLADRMFTCTTCQYSAFSGCVNQNLTTEKLRHLPNILATPRPQTHTSNIYSKVEKWFTNKKLTLDLIILWCKETEAHIVRQEQLKWSVVEPKVGVIVFGRHKLLFYGQCDSSCSWTWLLLWKVCGKGLGLRSVDKHGQDRSMSRMPTRPNSVNLCTSFILIYNIGLVTWIQGLLGLRGKPKAFQPYVATLPLYEFIKKVLFPLSDEWDGSVYFC